MKTEQELNDNILKITMHINEHFPELSKYIGEMPVTIPDENEPAIRVRQLQEYYDSLESLVKKYADNQDNSTN